MKHFITPPQRQGTCYHEFWRGKWDGKSFWAADSILLHDDVMDECPDFPKALLAVIPGYAPFGVTEVTRPQWEAVGRLADAAGGTKKELYDEADAWAREVFRTLDCFTILGI